MKLRIQNNTLRLRLTRSELARLEETGRVTAHTEFGEAPDQRLVYTLESSNESSNLSARYAHGNITVTLPPSLAREWIKSDEIGLEGEQVSGETAFLKIIVEKDLTCSKGNKEADSDTFPYLNGSVRC